MTDYNLDPALAAYVEESATFTSIDNDLSSQRESFARACRHFTPHKPENLKIEDRVVNGLAVRVYSPLAPAPSAGWPTVLYFHGGGWSMGSHATHDWFAFAVLRRARVAMVAVDYRLAPEHPFPAPLEDGLQIWQALRRGDFPELDGKSLAVAGDSAGGTLAAGLCIALNELNLSQPFAQILAYPVLSANADLDSMRVHADAPMLTAAGVLASLEGFVPEERLKADPRALALESLDVGELAPAFIGVAEYDPLFDHGIVYAERLRLAGVPVRLHVGKGLVHASLRASGVAEVESFYDAIGIFLQASMAS